MRVVIPFPLNPMFFDGDTGVKFGYTDSNGDKIVFDPERLNRITRCVLKDVNPISLDHKGFTVIRKEEKPITIEQTCSWEYRVLEWILIGKWSVEELDGYNDSRVGRIEISKEESTCLYENSTLVMVDLEQLTSDIFFGIDEKGENPFLKLPQEFLRATRILNEYGIDTNEYYRKIMHGYSRILIDDYKEVIKEEYREYDMSDVYNWIDTILGTRRDRKYGRRIRRIDESPIDRYLWSMRDTPDDNVGMGGWDGSDKSE